MLKKFREAVANLTGEPAEVTDEALEYIAMIVDCLAHANIHPLALKGLEAKLLQVSKDGDANVVIKSMKRRHFFGLVDRCASDGYARDDYYEGCRRRDHEVTVRLLHDMLEELAQVVDRVEKITRNRPKNDEGGSAVDADGNGERASSKAR